MEELLTAQQSTWEEKEKLSQQLEDERQNNVNAAIGQVILLIQSYTSHTLVIHWLYSTLMIFNTLMMLNTLTML